jgi:hypothetical protein
MLAVVVAAALRQQSMDSIDFVFVSSQFADTGTRSQILPRRGLRSYIFTQKAFTSTI